MSDKFVTVMKFHQSFEAQLAKNLLDNEDIASLLSGEQMSDLQLGNSAMGDQIVLQVREEDAQRAAGILAAVAAAKLDDNWEEEAESGAGVWICSICGEPISNRLSMCYSCQTPREGIRASAPRDPTAIQQEPVTLLTGEEVQKHDDSVCTHVLAPAPTPEPVVEETENQEVPPTAGGDDLARKALLASLSLLLMPIAWYYLLRVVLFGGELSTKGVRHLWGALLINGSIVLLVLYLCAGGRM